MMNDLVKLSVVKYEDYNFYLEDEDNNSYKFIIEFIGTEELKVGDTIYMSKTLLDPNYKEYSHMYSFGPIPSKFGRTITHENMHDVIKVVSDNGEMYLQRYYG